MPLPVFHLVLVLRLLPTMRMLVHLLYCSAHNALLASGHLQLPAGNLTCVEDSHPAHHEVPRADRLLLQHAPEMSTQEEEHDYGTCSMQGSMTNSMALSHCAH